MGTFKNFEEIDTWKNSKSLVVKTYEFTKTPYSIKDKILTDQIRRAGISIMANIAEGFERDGNKEFIHFLSVAKASCGEFRSLLYLANNLKYLDDNNFKEIKQASLEISKQIYKLIQYLKGSDYLGSIFK